MAKLNEVVFVLGAPRSGTSLITRLLSLAGCTLPNSLFAEDADNPTGYWDSVDAAKLNDEFVHNHRSGPCDPRINFGLNQEVSNSETEQFVRNIASFLTQSATGPILIVKNPEITPVAHLWLRAAIEADLYPSVLVAIRNPNEAIDSASQCSNTMGTMPSKDWMSASWLKYNLLAERHSRGYRRIFVDYANVLAGWRRELSRISLNLSLDIHEYDAGSIDSFIRPDLYRVKNLGPISDPFSTRWISTTYRILSEAARDRAVDQGSLDTVFDEYASCERTFRSACEGFMATVNHPGYEGARKQLHSRK